MEMRRIGLVKEDKEEMYGKDQMEDGMEEEMVDKEEMLDKGQGGGDQGGQAGSARQLGRGRLRSSR